jgi:hypothetical protein
MKRYEEKEWKFQIFELIKTKMIIKNHHHLEIAATKTTTTTINGDSSSFRFSFTFLMATSERRNLKSI